MVLTKFHALPGFVQGHTLRQADIACNALAFVDEYAGSSFGRGCYRVLEVEEGTAWSRLAERFFAKRIGQYQCFAQDWLGRLYVEDGDDGLVKLACHLTDDVLNTEANVCEFHENLLPKMYSEIVDAPLLDRLLNRDGAQCISRDRVYSLARPLNLGGKFDADNLQLGYSLVDWELALQLKSQL